MTNIIYINKIKKEKKVYNIQMKPPKRNSYKPSPRGNTQSPTSEAGGSPPLKKKVHQKKKEAPEGQQHQRNTPHPTPPRR